jgi:predicted PurR-regulated permease PerM
VRVTLSTPPLGPEPHRYARHVFFGATALAVVAVVALGHAVILPFLLAIVVGYVLFPAVRIVERARMPRWIAILVVYAVTLGGMYTFGWAVVPRLLDETKKLSAELPRLLQSARDRWLPQIDARLQRWTGREGGAPDPSHPAAGPTPDGDARAPIVVVPRADGSYEIRIQDELELRPQRDGAWSLQPSRPQQRFSSERALRDAFDHAVSWAQANTLELLDLGRRVVAGVSRGIFYFFITLMLAGYLMYTFERIHKFMRDMVPAYRHQAFDRFLRRLDRGLAGVVRGQLLICLVNGVLSAIGFWIFGLKYWPILSLIAAAMSIIPIFGSILSSIPAVAIGLTQSFGTAFGVLVWILAIHQLEANFLNPKIIGDQAKIHPVLVVFALLFGEHFFQITGALLAVPVLAIAQAVFLHFREGILGLPSHQFSFPPSIPPPPNTLRSSPPPASGTAAPTPRSAGAPPAGDT